MRQPVVAGANRGVAWAVDAPSVAAPPLVSVVVINWNYAAYVGEAIQSIKNQDYTHLEIVVVDNGSSDSSRSVITECVGEHPNTRIVHLEQNLGQLGAFFEIFNELSGQFVTIVDADDVLNPNFVSSHLQVHLALPTSVAFTSSNIIEITSDGRTLTGSYAAFGTTRNPISRGLRPIGAALRLSTVTDAEYLLLDRFTSTYSGGSGWMWGPGTSNMYRRSVLALTHQQSQDRTYFRAVDSYLNRLCHAFGGSALIDRHLSAYRVHATNYFAERESVHNLKKGRFEARARLNQERRQTLHFLFQRAEFFKSLLPGERYWQTVDQLSGDLCRRDGKFKADPASVRLFADSYEQLRLAFGEAYLWKRLRKLLPHKELRAVVRKAHGGSIPLRLSLELWRRRDTPTRTRLMRAINRILHTPKFLPRVKIKTPPKETQQVPRSHASVELRPSAVGSEHPPIFTPAALPKETTQQVPRSQAAVEFGPVALVSEDPPIFMTGIAFEEYLGIAPAFGRMNGSLPAAFLIYPCWSLEDHFRSSAVIDAARKHKEKYPAHELVFLCNTPAERHTLSSAGLVAHLLNKNFILSETTFRPLPDVEVEFDAIYNARFDPMKRHWLARKIPRAAYLSYEDSTDSDELKQKQREALAEILLTQPNHVLLNRMENGLPVRISPDEVNAALSRAAVGLCLSKVEGSNYASMEYMLAGLPIVSTPSVGGRDVYFDHEYCTICEPKASAVRDAVAALKARNIPRDYIRTRTLAKIEPVRHRFLSLIDDLRQSLGGKRCHDQGVWPFGVRELLTWRTFQGHLSNFEARQSLRLAASNQLGPDIDCLLADSTGIQMQQSELQAIVGAIRSRPGCSLLVFGCGHDSAIWEQANRHGETVFLEDNSQWADRIRPRLSSASIYLVQYDTALSEWQSLLDSPDALELKLPEAVSSRGWDVVVVDGPAGFDDHEKYGVKESPGRMKSIYMASKLVAPGGVVFVHDCDRLVEQRYATLYLGTVRSFISIKGRGLLQGYAF